MRKNSNQNNRHHYKSILNDPYYEELMTLHYRPLAWVNEDWLKEIPYINMLRKINSASSQANIVSMLNIPGVSTIDFNDPIKRLIFLSSNELLRLINIIGLSCFYKKLAILIEKQVKQDLISQFGQAAVSLIQYKTPFLISEYPPTLESHLSLKNENGDSIRSFQGFGARLLKIAIAEQASEKPVTNVALTTNSHWFTLLKYKLPKFDELATDTISLQKIELDRLRIFIKKIALEVEPRCTNLLK